MIEDGRNLVAPGSRWRHYTGTEYVAVDVVLLESSNEVAVLYHSVLRPEVSFVRALSVWLERVIITGVSLPCFERV
jgi:hypothetical protein